MSWSAPIDPRPEDRVSQMSVVSASARERRSGSELLREQESDHRGEADGRISCKVDGTGVRSALGVGVAFPKSGVSG